MIIRTRLREWANRPTIQEWADGVVADTVARCERERGRLEYESWLDPAWYAEPATERAPPPTDPVQLGRHAKQLLEDPVLILALERIKEKAATGFMASAPLDADKREAFYRLNWAAQQFESELHIMVGRGKVIEADVARAKAR